MLTGKLSNVNDTSRMRSAVLPDGMVLRMPEGVLCSCGRPFRNDPEPLTKGFRVICGACHQDVLCYESQS